MKYYRVKKEYKKFARNNSGEKISAVNMDLSEPIKVIRHTGEELDEGGNVLIEYTTTNGNRVRGYIDEDMLEEWNDV